MAGRAPVKAMTMLMMKEANSPTAGSTPATKEKAMTSGISAKVATAPAMSSRGMLGAHLARKGWGCYMEMAGPVALGVTGRGRICRRE